MRFFLFHCKKISFKDIRKSNRPPLIIPSDKQEKEFENILVVFICIEKWDDDNEIEKCIELISDHMNLLNQNKILLIPFAHLSYYLAEPQRALEIISQIASELDKKGFFVSKSSFSYHKELKFVINELSLYGHPGSVAFRKLPDNIEKEIKNYITEYGVSNTLRLIQTLSEARDE